MDHEINIIAGIDKLLHNANVDILRLLVRDGYVDAMVITERAKQVLCQCEDISAQNLPLVDFLVEIDAMDSVLAQKILKLIFKTTRKYDDSYYYPPMDVVHKLINSGASIPPNPKYLCKLKFDDFVEQIELNACPINYDLEAKCLRYFDLEIMKWVRKNTCEPIETIMTLLNRITCFSNMKANFYVKELICNPKLVDSLFILLFYSSYYYLKIDKCEHVCNEELSFFIVLAVRRTHLPLCTTLSHFLHPNTTKYLTQPIQFREEYLQLCENVLELHRQGLKFDAYCDQILKNSRILLDHVESENIFDD